MLFTMRVLRMASSQQANVHWCGLYSVCTFQKT